MAMPLLAISAAMIALRLPSCTAAEATDPVCVRWGTVVVLQRTRTCTTGGVERVTAAEAEVLERRAAGSLAAAGARPGDRVVLSAPSSAALLCAALGALRSGVVPVLLDPALTPAERDPLVADADPALVVAGAGAVAALAEGGREAELAPVPLGRPMHFTSGTTGRPRGVWTGVLDEAAANALADEEAELWGFATDDVHLVCSPLHHSAPLRFAGGTLRAGGDVVLLGRFEAEAFAEAVAAERPTTTFVVPAHLQRLFGPDGPALPPLSSFRLLAHAAAPCPEPLKRAALAAFPEGTVWEFYGSTEGQFTACPPGDWLERPGTVGRARPGRRLRTEPDGTIWCEVPDFARFTYWRDPAKTAAAWRGDAFTVGDLGRLDDEGYLWLDGRREDLLISGGVNVYPLEVERALAACPGVDEVAVFGAPDERWGTRVCAAVVGAVEPDALRAFARERLAPAKRPKTVVRVAELPRTERGKLRRSALAAQLGVAPPLG
jgi:acyl-CoA synthetase (AMP-forming)/AMP-acid ligase II